MSSGSAKSNRKRYRLHKEQNGVCYYCPDTIGILIEQKGSPVLEHYIPQSAGGTRVVLACSSCDKMKGMIPGPEFEEILREHLSTGKNAMQIRQAVAGHCKKRNVELQAKHEPRWYGQTQTQRRTIAIAKSVGVSIADCMTFVADTNPVQKFKGDIGRDKFIEEWDAKYKPQTGDSMA